MTATRWAAGLATVLTAMLLQATFVGPLLVPLPASLPMVVIAAIALLSGPSTGITLGFAGGLLIDLGSSHPLGIMAFVGLGVGLAGGVLGGMVMPRRPVALKSRPVRYASRRARTAAKQGARRRQPRPVSMRREQALLIGLVAGVGAVLDAVILAVVDAQTDPLQTTLARCAPAAVLDAILALAVLPLVAAALRSPRLRPPAAIDPPEHTGAARVYQDVAR